MGISRDSAHKRRLTGGRRKQIRKKRKFEMGRQPSHTKVGETSVHKVRVRGGNFKYRALRLDHGNFTWIGEAVSCKARIMKVVYNATSNELIRTNTLVKSCIVQIDATPFKVWYKKFYGHLPGEKEKKDQPVTKKAEKAKKAKAEAAKKDDKKKLRKSTTTLKQYKKMLLKVKAATKEQKLAAIKEARDAKKKAGAKKDAKKPTSDPKSKVPKKTGEKKWEKPKKPPTANPESKSHKEKVAKRNKNHHLEASLEELLRTGKFYARITSRPGQVGRADGIILEGEELAFYQRKLKK